MPRPTTPEAFRQRYQITAARSGELYDRAQMRMLVRKSKLLSLLPEHLEEALALVDDDAWMSFRKGMTPGGIVGELEHQILGIQRSRSRWSRTAPEEARPKPEKAKKIYHLVGGVTVTAMTSVLATSPEEALRKALARPVEISKDFRTNDRTAWIVEDADGAIVDPRVDDVEDDDGQGEDGEGSEE